MIFIDSGFIYSYVNPKDKLHSIVAKKMRHIFHGKYGTIITSNYIIDEVLTLARARTKDCRLSFNIQQLLNIKLNKKRIFKIMVIDHFILPLIDTFYQKYCEKGLSYTDCSILAIMDKYRIQFLATTDNGFKGLVRVI